MRKKVDFYYQFAWMNGSFPYNFCAHRFEMRVKTVEVNVTNNFAQWSRDEKTVLPQTAVTIFAYEENKVWT